jgi:hypothetical protein
MASLLLVTTGSEKLSYNSPLTFTTGRRISHTGFTAERRWTRFDRGSVNFSE